MPHRASEPRPRRPTKEDLDLAAMQENMEVQERAVFHHAVCRYQLKSAELEREVPQTIMQNPILLEHFMKGNLSILERLIGADVLMYLGAIPDRLPCLLSRVREPLKHYSIVHGIYAWMEMTPENDDIVLRKLANEPRSLHICLQDMVRDNIKRQRQEAEAAHTPQAPQLQHCTLGTDHATSAFGRPPTRPAIDVNQELKLDMPSTSGTQTPQDSGLASSASSTNGGFAAEVAELFYKKYHPLPSFGSIQKEFDVDEGVDEETTCSSGNGGFPDTTPQPTPNVTGETESVSNLSPFAALLSSTPSETPACVSGNGGFPDRTPQPTPNVTGEIESVSNLSPYAALLNLLSPSISPAAVSANVSATLPVSGASNPMHHNNGLMGAAPLASTILQAASYVNWLMASPGAFNGALPSTSQNQVLNLSSHGLLGISSVQSTMPQAAVKVNSPTGTFNGSPNILDPNYLANFGLIGAPIMSTLPLSSFSYGESCSVDSATTSTPQEVAAPVELPVEEEEMEEDQEQEEEKQIDVVEGDETPLDEPMEEQSLENFASTSVLQEIAAPVDQQEEEEKEEDINIEGMIEISADQFAKENLDSISTPQEDAATVEQQEEEQEKEDEEQEEEYDNSASISAPLEFAAPVDQQEEEKEEQEEQEEKMEDVEGVDETPEDKEKALRQWILVNFASISTPQDAAAPVEQQEQEDEGEEEQDDKFDTEEAVETPVDKPMGELSLENSASTSTPQEVSAPVEQQVDEEKEEQQEEEQEWKQEEEQQKEANDDEREFDIEETVETPEDELSLENSVTVPVEQPVEEEEYVGCEEEEVEDVETPVDEPMGQLSLESIAPTLTSTPQDVAAPVAAPVEQQEDEEEQEQEEQEEEQEGEQEEEKQKEEHDEERSEEPLVDQDSSLVVDNKEDVVAYEGPSFPRMVVDVDIDIVVDTEEKIVAAEEGPSSPRAVVDEELDLIGKDQEDSVDSEDEEDEDSDLSDEDQEDSDSSEDRPLSPGEDADEIIEHLGYQEDMWEDSSEEEDSDSEQAIFEPMYLDLDDLRAILDDPERKADYERRREEALEAEVKRRMDQEKSNADKILSKARKRHWKEKQAQDIAEAKVKALAREKAKQKKEARRPKKAKAPKAVAQQEPDLPEAQLTQEQEWKPLTEAEARLYGCGLRARKTRPNMYVDQDTEEPKKRKTVRRKRKAAPMKEEEEDDWLDDMEGPSNMPMSNPKKRKSPKKGKK